VPSLPRHTGGAAPFRARLLPPDGEDRERHPVDGLFPPLAADELWEAFFLLLYQQHGGSGLHLTLNDVLELDLDRIRWLLERLGEQREKEAREIEAAARRARRG
jgi:hypothetical protein